MVSFESFKLSEPVLRALAEMGFESPSPIQEAIVPVLLTGRDAIGEARTGTGKTAAFAIPMVEAAMKGGLGLVLAPTRELARQVAVEVDRIGANAGVKALAIYGGAPFGAQAREIERGDARVLVATPGRLLDHVERGTLELSGVRFVVVDEADEMLSMGFIEEIEKILALLAPERQTALFSATMPHEIVRLAERHLTNPEKISAIGAGESVTTTTTAQFVVGVTHAAKLGTLLRLLAVERPDGMLVFRHTRETVDELVDALRAAGVAAEGLHGGLAQSARDAVIARLRDGRVRVVVATNVAARGLDVERLTHVVNYDAPGEADAYVHRIGRTGRAGRDGTSFLFVTQADRGRLRGIERTLGERLRWRDVPTDEEVAAAADAHVAKWIDERSQDPDMARELAVIDALVAEGKPLRSVAAALLKSAAKHEGLAPPNVPPLPSAAPRRANAERSDAPRAALVFNVGRSQGVLPGDLVGALTNGAGLDGSEVGRIDLLPMMSVVEVPEHRADEIIVALEGATIRRVPVRARRADRWEFRSQDSRRNVRPARPHARRQEARPW